MSPTADDFDAAARRKRGFTDEDLDAAARRKSATATPAIEVEPENPRWCWQEWAPLGGVTVLAGPPGLGKSTLTLHLAARLSRGTLDGDLLGVPSEVLLISLEDHSATVVRPRLQAAGADLEAVRLVSVDELVTFPDDLGAVEHLIETHRARLLVIDPVVATLSADLDSHRDQSVRRALAPLAQLAERHDLTVLAVMHFSKRKTADLLSRVAGSIGFGGAARSVVVFVRDPTDEDEERPDRVIVHAKSNWGRKAESLGAIVESADFTHRGERIETSRLRITGPSNVTAADLAVDGAEHSELDDAAEFLLDTLASGAWTQRKEIDAHAKRHGVSRRTLYRAASRMIREGRLERRRVGFPAVAEWRIAVVPTPDEQTNGTTGESPVTTGDLGTSGSPVVPRICSGTTAAAGQPHETDQERAERLLERWGEAVNRGAGK